MSIEAMKLALDFISRLKFADAEPEPDKVMKALRTAIEQAEKQEPICVAFIRTYLGKDQDGIEIWKDEPIYTAPPPRQPLTDKEISDLWDGHTVPVFGKTGINPIVFARAIEQAHGIKENT
jgi:hypothetical protein